MQLQRLEGFVRVVGLCMKVVNPFYKSKKWKRKRELILKRDDYLCQLSKRFGKSTAANTVHHIYPLELYPELALVNWNLTSVNESEHNKIHDRNSNEIIGEGIALQNKFKNEFKKFYGTPPPHN